MSIAGLHALSIFPNAERSFPAFFAISTVVSKFATDKPPTVDATGCFMAVFPTYIAAFLTAGIDATIAVAAAAVAILAPLL